MTKSYKDLCWVTNEFKYKDKVLTADMCNTNEENRILFCTTLASVSRGKFVSNNPEVRYKALLKEASPCDETPVGSFDQEVTGTPSRPLEFIGVMLKAKLDKDKVILRLFTESGNILEKEFIFQNFNNLIGRFSYIKSGNDTMYPLDIYTNMRCLLNAGIKYEYIPYNTQEELNSFKAVRVRAPMFVFNHLVTHTALSKEARSERVVDFLSDKYDEELFDFYPEPFNKPFWYPSCISKDEFECLLTEKSFIDVIKYLKDEKKLKKEIYNRALLEFRYKDFMLVAWNNSFTWEHLFLERSATDRYKNWTQEETRLTVKTIKEVLGL